MWIMTQNRQRIVNADNVTSIFIDKTGTKLYANETSTDDNILLAEYADRSTCVHVIGDLLDRLNSHETFIRMPLGGEVDKWLD